MRILLGEKLRRLREEKGITQTELAKHLNCSPKMLSNYELNKREPDLLMIKNICDFFEISADYLLDRTFNRNGQDNSSDEILEQLIKNYKNVPLKFKNEILRYSKLINLDYKLNSPD